MINLIWLVEKKKKKKDAPIRGHFQLSPLKTSILKYSVVAAIHFLKTVFEIYKKGYRTNCKIRASFFFFTKCSIQIFWSHLEPNKSKTYIINFVR